MLREEPGRRILVFVVIKWGKIPLLVKYGHTQAAWSIETKNRSQ
jgi:hypothetical protein